MIAIDLSPLAFAPRRGVARALLHLLAGLKCVDLDGLHVRGYVPNVPEEALGLRAGVIEGAHVVGPPTPSPRVWRAALAESIEEDGVAVLLSPWAAFPKTRVPVVAWIHEVPWVGRGALEGHVRTLRHRLALARAVRRAAALVVPSESVHRDLLTAHPDARAKAHVVPHGFLPRVVDHRRVAGRVDLFGVSTRVEVDQVQPGGSCWVVTPRHAYGGPLPREPYVVLLGSGRGAAGPWKKGVDVFLDAFQDGRLAGLTPVIVGDPGPGLGTRPAGLCVLSEPDDVEVAELVAGARVLVVPSRSEGFGYPVLEGFAASVPVVASAAGALPEVAGGAARLVPPGDVDTLTEAILRMHVDEDLRARLIKAGQRRATEFPVEAMARGWLRVLAKAGGIPWRA